MDLKVGQKVWVVALEAVGSPSVHEVRQEMTVTSIDSTWANLDEETTQYRWAILKGTREVRQFGPGKIGEFYDSEEAAQQAPKLDIPVVKPRDEGNIFVQLFYAIFS
jgi:hypothetical protein